MSIKISRPKSREFYQVFKIRKNSLSAHSGPNSGAFTLAIRTREKPNPKPGFGVFKPETWVWGFEIETWVLGFEPETWVLTKSPGLQTTTTI